MKWINIFTAVTTTLGAIVSANPTEKRAFCRNPAPCNTFRTQEVAACGAPWWNNWCACKATGCWDWRRYGDPVRNARCARYTDPNVLRVCQSFTSTTASPCSSTWWYLFRACKATGCVKWSVDPGAQCSGCNNPFHPCKTYSTKRECSSEWTNLLRQCLRTSCAPRFQVNPEAKCRVCSACGIMDRYRQCSPDWYAWYAKCKAANCRQWLVNPELECRKCTNWYHPCNAMRRAPRCSATWKVLVTRCRAANPRCVNFPSDPLAQCPR